MPQINIIDFTEAVAKMRKFQKQYARTKDYFCSQAALKAEKEVDNFITIYETRTEKKTDIQQKLF